MGVVIKSAKRVFVRKDNRKIISGETAAEIKSQRVADLSKAEKELATVQQEKQVLEAATTGDTEAQLKRLEELENKEKELLNKKVELSVEQVKQVDAFGVLIYRESFFDYFYKKHVKHETSGDERDATVLVMDNDKIPSRDIVRKALEESTKGVLYQKRVFRQPSVPIPQVVKGHRLGVRLWNFKSNRFVTEAVDGVFILREVYNVTFRAELAKFEIDIDPKDMAQVVKFREDSKKPDSDFAVKYILFIGKYFVAFR